MKRTYLFIAILFAFVACSDDDGAAGGSETSDNVTLSLSDKSATTETKALYANLWKIQQTGFMFGHHDDLLYGRYWKDTDGASDTKEVCGDYPAVFSVDLAEVMDDRSQTDEGKKDIEARRRCILEARGRGEVITALCHLNNPLTGGDSWDASSTDVTKQILTDGSDTQNTFKTWLDRLADFLADLKDDQGNSIPIIFRPFHEHSQSWPWWGTACTTEDEFIGLWKFTVNYLRNAKGLHQLIFAISPQIDTTKTLDDFLFRWPGDDYVDFLGMDCYHGLNPEVFSKNLRSIAKLSQEKKKPCGVTETGVEGFTDKNYWTEQILTPSEGRKVSMIVMWRNKFVGGDESDTHYYSVFKGHSSESNFIKFYNSPYTYFSKDLPDMYTMPENMSIE